MEIKTYLVSQFGRPRGPIGAFVGRLMAIKNRPRNRWMVELVDPRPQDSILEVGFGPGATLAMLAEQAIDGYVAGIDHSELMVNQARRHNKSALASGRLDIRLGQATSLPFPDETFDKVCASNVNLFWENEVLALREIMRVLRPCGSMTMALQPHWAKSEAEIRSIASELESDLRAGGFASIDVRRKPMRPVVCLAAIGFKGEKPKLTRG